MHAYHSTVPFWKHSALKLNQDSMIDNSRAEIVDKEDDEKGANSKEDDLNIDDVAEAQGDPFHI